MCEGGHRSVDLPNVPGTLDARGAEREQVMSHFRAGGSVSLVAGLMLVLSRCGLDDVSQVIVAPPSTGPDAGLHAASHCVPGQTLSCMGVCGEPVAGYQVCAADGRSYGQCECPPPARVGPPGTEGNGVATLVPGLGLPVVPLRPVPSEPERGTGVIGAACQRDADCSGGLDCLDGATDSLGAGGPSRGYCTKPCDSLAECTGVDPLSACAVLAGQNVCARLCESQAPLDGEDKCLGRSELTCTSLAALGEEPSEGAQLGICVPACQSDAACPGRHCDLRTGLCTDEAPRGSPIGSACEGAEQCSGGVCLGRAAQTGRFCSAYCTVGVAGCGFDGSETTIDAACLLPQVPGEGQGDRGLCFELCDDAADCQQPGAVCVPEPRSGRAGVCLTLPPTPEPEGPPEGPEPVADAGAAPSQVIGASCEADADCGAVGLCLTSDGDPLGVGGGPAGGYCSSPCVSDVECTEAGSLCVFVQGQGFCLRGCDPAAADACGGRDTLTCTRLSGSQRGFCRPQCSADADCGERVCDVEGGLCVDPPPAGACEDDGDCEEGVCDPTSLVCIEAPPVSVGAACAEDADCGGTFCAELDGSAFCSSFCLLGSALGCEPFGSDAFCLLPITGEPELGFCTELCDEPSDCTQAGYLCEPLTEPLPNGRTGTCLPPLPLAP